MQKKCFQIIYILPQHELYTQYKKFKKIKKKADLILASNVFAHSDNLKEMAQCMLSLLSSNGTIIIEVQYLMNTLKDLTFDNIYHEHYNYWSLISLKNFFNQFDATIYKAEKINTHGGSIRVYVKKGKKIKTDKLGLNNERFIDTFDILLMGDSFAEGSCVNQLDEPANLLNQNYNLKTYNTGISGNGPLLSLALAHEIKPLIDFHTIIWLIFDNDFYDINLEIQSSFLKNYLIKKCQVQSIFIQTL